MKDIKVSIRQTDVKSVQFSNKFKLTGNTQNKMNVSANVAVKLNPSQPTTAVVVCRFEAKDEADSIEFAMETLTSVSVDTSQTGRVIFSFFKDGESGLYPVEGGRKVIIKLTTTLNEDWIALKTDRDDLRYYNTHTNHAQVVANGYTIEKSASVTVNGTEPELIKKADAHFADNFHWKNWDEGNNLEAWLYRLYLYGISDDSFKDGYLEISDTFDNQYLKYYDPTDQNVFTNNGEIQRFHQKLTSGSEIGNYLNPVDIEAIVEGGTITFRHSHLDFCTYEFGNF